jgi:hypothetical protein
MDDTKTNSGEDMIRKAWKRDMDSRDNIRINGWDYYIKPENGCLNAYVGGDGSSLRLTSGDASHNECLMAIIRHAQWKNRPGENRPAQ